MITYKTIQDLFDDLSISKPSISDGFNIYKYSELEEVNKRIFEPHRKRFFSINFHVKNVTARRIGYTYFDKLDRSINFNSPMQIFNIEGEKRIGKEGFGIFFNSEFLKEGTHRFNVICQFPFFKLNAIPYYKLTDEHFIKINDAMERIYTEFIKDEKYSLDIIRAELIALLFFLKRITRIGSKTIELRRPEKITLKFEDLILRDINSDKTLAYYAKKLNITPAYLAECVKKTTGTTAKKVVIDYKILQAKALLKNTDLSIAEISMQMGYSEATNFVKFFRQNQGVTPLAYRNS
ncbi:helix-turn-helix domain-containing protein [Aquimarina algicola]|uniref:Helix-turn-helix transcriptional regulator n=1 Tax=Aquimarina algicola TaxID=2589995 RepID=A0A504IXJ1_9FLAO|nr:AraC family transcriptional regulator [Aquimarina algicola]TPN82774.1 helix-turn-helix transcriptional regulator [Aquimarina algicola]